MAITNASEADPAKLASRAFALAFQAYTECCSEVQAAIREMSAIVNDPVADEDEREMALSTIADALFPQRHDGHIGIDIAAWDRLDSRRQSEEASELDREEAEFGDRVHALLRDRQWTQAQLAARIGVGQSAVSMMLSRKARPQARTVCKIAEALDVPPLDLWPSLLG